MRGALARGMYGLYGHACEVTPAENPESAATPTSDQADSVGLAVDIGLTFGPPIWRVCKRLAFAQGVVFRDVGRGEERGL